MTNFLKAFGRGVLYVVLFPFAIVLVCCYAVVGFFIFLFLIFKSVILFFKGKTIFSDLPEDIEAKRILLERENAQQSQMENIIPNHEPASNDSSPLSLYPSDSNMYKSDFSGLEINKPQINETDNEPQPHIEQEPIITNQPDIPSSNKNEEIIGTYKPLNSNNKDQK